MNIERSCNIFKCFSCVFCNVHIRKNSLCSRNTNCQLQEILENNCKTKLFCIKLHKKIKQIKINKKKQILLYIS